MYTFEITGDMLVTELDGVEIEGPQITWPDSVVVNAGESLTLVDPASATEYSVTSGNTLTARQVGVLRNGLVHDVAGSMTMTVTEAYNKLRELHRMTVRQQDSILVDRILNKLNSARRAEDMSEGQDALSIRIIDALANGTSFGNGQEHLDRAVAALNPKVKDGLLQRFMLADNRGQYSKAFGLFETLVGKFNRNVGQRAAERQRTAIVAVTADQMEAWSGGQSVATTKTKAEKKAESEALASVGADSDEPS